MKISQVMTRNPETFPPNTPIQVIAEHMEKLDCGFIPIAENGSIVGTVTDRDIVMRAIAKGRDPKEIKAKDVMTREVFKVSKDQDVQEAADEMCKHQIRRLVVLDDSKRICGVISLGDIASKCKDLNIDAEIIETVSERQ